MCKATQPSQNGTGSVRSWKRASIEKTLFPQASAAQKKARATGLSLLGALLLLLAVALLFVSVPVPMTASVAGGGIVLWLASAWLAALISPFDGRFRRGFGAPRVLELEDQDSRQVKRARLYLKGAREEGVRRQNGWSEAQKCVLALAVLGMTEFGFKYYESHKVMTQGIYQEPPTLAYLDPVLNDPATRPTVLANLPVKVLPVGRKASDALTHFVSYAPGHLEAMHGAAVTGNKEGVTKAADSLDRDIQAADDSLREVETSAVSPEIRKSASEARNKLAAFKTTVQKGRQDPNQIKQAQDELTKVIQFLRSLLDALARFLYQLLQFLQILSGGMPGNGVSVSTATQGATMAAKGVKGQMPTQAEWDQLRSSYGRDFDTMPPTFVPPPATPVPGTPSPSDPVIGLTVPPVLSPSTPAKRETDRGNDKTPVKPEQKNPNQTGPVAPNS